jgi:hypothetical protein
LLIKWKILKISKSLDDFVFENNKSYFVIFSNDIIGITEINLLNKNSVSEEKLNNILKIILFKTLLIICVVGFCGTM